MRSLPVGPDPLVRARVRRVARRVVATDPWVDQEPTAERIARLALLRCLDLQLEVRRAAQTGQYTAAAILARSSVEACLLGAYFYVVPADQLELLRGDLGRSLQKLIGYAAESLIGETFAEETREEFGTGRLPDLLTVARTVDESGAVAGAVGLYRAYYVPLSVLYSHTTGVSLLRQTRPAVGRYRRRAWRTWSRRSPAHLADTCLALLTRALLGEDDAAAADLERYAASHRRRAVPILVTLTAKLMMSGFDVRHVLAAGRELWGLRRDAGAGELGAATPEEVRARVLQVVQTMSRAATGSPGDSALQERILDRLAARGLFTPPPARPRHE